MFNQQNKVMEYKHNYIEKHPLRDAYCVHNRTLKFIPPFIGTKKECERAIKFAEESTIKWLKEHGINK